MVEYVGSAPPGQYETVAAGQSDQVLGGNGNAGDFLDNVTIIAATTTPGAVTIKDGSTTVYSSPAGTATVLPYIVNIPFKMYSVSGAWKVTTGSNVSVVAVGKFY